MLTIANYVKIYGRAETIQLKPVIESGGDIIDYVTINLENEDYLIKAVASANALVSLYLDDTQYEALFERYAAIICRYFLHFNSQSDALDAGYKNAMSDLARLKTEFMLQADYNNEQPLTFPLARYR